MTYSDHIALVNLLMLVTTAVGTPVTPHTMESHPVDDPHSALESSTKRNIAIGIFLAFATGSVLTIFIYHEKRRRQSTASDQFIIEPTDIPMVLHGRSLPP